MDLSTVGNALLWVWFLLMPPTPGGHADLLTDLAQLRQPQSGRFSLSGAARFGPQLIGLGGQGAFVQPDRFQLSFEAEGQRFEQILIGQTIYTRSSNDADWRAIDSPAMLGRERGSLPPGSEQALLDALSTFQLVGTETLSGSPTRHYAGDVDLLALIPAISGDATAREALEAFQMRLEFWIGIEDRYLHQVKAAFEVRGRSTRTDVPNSLTADISMTFFDFEQAISIEPPIGQRAPTAFPRPAPAQAPAQVPSRAPARLPGTGQGSAGLLPPMVLGWALLGLGLRLRRARDRPWRARRQ